jgi:hypothetical protein
MGRSRASELRSIGKIKYLREKKVPSRQIKAFSYACGYVQATLIAFDKPTI